MKLGSLCSGAGGLDLAVERVFGAETVWHCELDPAASKVLAYRWPGVPNHGDLINTDWNTVEPVDIMCFGWPCQPFSIAGKRKGHEDERAIWPHIADAVRLVRPRICVMENVPTVLGSEFRRVANDMAALGYDLRWTCLRASDVGAPHRRERLFVIAHHGGEGLQRTRTGRHEQAQPEHVGDCRSVVADASGERHGGWQDGGVVGQMDRREEEADGQRQRAWEFAGDRGAAGGDGPVNLLPAPQAADGSGGKTRKVSNGRSATGGKQSTNLPEITNLLPTPQARDSKGVPRDDYNQSCLPRDIIDCEIRWGKYEPAIRRWEHVVGPAPQPIPGVAGLKRPRLNPAFSEWMMGWPAGWVTDVPSITRNDKLRIVGNGVVPQQAAAALQWLLSLEAVA